LDHGVRNLQKLERKILQICFSLGFCFFGFVVPDCTKKNNLAKKWKKLLKFFARKL